MTAIKAPASMEKPEDGQFLNCICEFSHNQFEVSLISAFNLFTKILCQTEANFCHLDSLLESSGVCNHFSRVKAVDY